ncbi:MAG: ABC transporter permease subunit [Eubacterium sp.]|nr:ABC transporter permease subunit [Eubacterium sp.]
MLKKRWVAILLLVILAATGVVSARAAEENSETSVTPEFQTFSELSGKRVSMLNGAPFEELVSSKVPNVGEFSYFANMADMLLVLRNDKTDAILLNNAVSQLAVNRNPELAMFPEDLQDSVFGIAFAKGDKNRDTWQSAFESIPEEELKKAWEKWTGADESVKVMPEQDWAGSGGTVQVAACDTLEPMSYAGENGELKGFDLEVILMMAKKLDVHVEFVGMEFSAIMAYVQSGKALMGAGSIIVTDERKESVDFVEYYPAAFVLIVRGVQSGDAESGGIWDSFYKTFIREERWKMYVSGIITTLVITLLSALFGTILGFGIFLLCRRGNPVANGITRFCMWVIRGMPMVVLLMVLYYIVFGNTSIDGVIVAVIGFTLTFGTSVFGLLKMGVGAVDRGQYEAAYALGYSNRQTFFRIIFPQALPHVMPAYRGEIVNLIKATAVVGYIAVQDLTKIGDIVRSRTYEAFFPLIALTIIYFLLEGLLGFAVSRIHANIDPKRRSREKILKGVKTDD